jgi:uncharacterized protein (TIGR01777 family)
MIKNYDAYIISGGTGLIGTFLINTLLKGNIKVYVLTRTNKVSENPLLNYVKWDVINNTINGVFLEENICVVNLVGANVANGRWTNSRKKEILESRTNSTKLLYNYIANGSINCTYFVSASAIGIYGEKNEIFTEDSPIANDFLGETCKLWEDEVNNIRTLNIPVGILRLGIVLSKDGGALPEFLNSLKFKIAAVPASGKQIYSWIHIYDACNMIMYATQNLLNEAYNAVAPNVCNSEKLLTTLGKKYCGTFLKINIPSFFLKIILGEFSIEILKSVHVSCSKISKHGFNFKYPDIDNALENIVTEIKQQ